MAMGTPQITGGNSAGSLQVILPYDVVPGTYSITEGTEEDAIYSDCGQDSYWPGTGTIIVSKHDIEANIIEGTFTASLNKFSTNEVLEITTGVFKITYIEQ